MAAKQLDRASALFALTQYLVEANHGGYRPDPRKVLAVRSVDRGCWLREAAVRSRWEQWYFVEGEIFPDPGATRLAEGETVEGLAGRLLDSAWDDLSLWSGYDFTATSYGLGNNTYLREDLAAEGRVFPGSFAPL
jgi:hypothetical protein